MTKYTKQILEREKEDIFKMFKEDNKIEHKCKFEEIDTGWDFDEKFNWVVEECSICGKMRESTREGWIFR